MIQFTRKMAMLGTATLLFAGSATTGLAADVTLRMHQFLPPQANVPKHILDVWADKVEADSNDSIKIERFPSMQLGGKPTELMDQAIDGVADIVWTVVGYTPGRFPRTEVFELPFLMKDAEAMSRAYWDLFEQEMRDTEFKDLHILATWVHGAGIIHSADPIETMEDLQGVKVRGGSRMVNNLLTLLGATPVGMPVPAISEALSKGVISATTIPWEVTESLKVPELVKNHTEFGSKSLYTLTFVLAMNKAKYESLSDEQKKVIDDNSGMELSAMAGRVMQEYDVPSREIAVKLGNNIIELPDDEVLKWENTAEPIYAEWIEDMNKRGIDGAGLLFSAKELLKKYESQ